LLLVFGFCFISNSGSNEKKAEACFACHGKDGTSATALTPSLGGQPSFFTVAQLFLFRDARRNKQPTPMDAFAKGLSDADLQSLAAVFEKQKPPAPPARPPERAKFERGRKLADAHNCGNCHNPDYSGRDQMPRLANQREDYLLKAMRDYKGSRRVGYGSASMPEVLSAFSDADMSDLAHFLAHVAPAARRR
jgi:cytochrome c553